MTETTKSGLAEFIGTFTLVFVGAGAGALLGGEGTTGLIGVALAHGFILSIIVYTWGPISGAHVNPAVTFGVLVAGKIDLPKALCYWISQLLGGIAAAYLLMWLVGAESGLGQTVGRLTNEGATAKVLVLEAVLTFFLVAAVFGSAVTGRNGNAYGIAIGFVLTGDILAGGPLTGASMNPARTLGPALAAGNLGYVWMYFIGPLVGGLVVGALFRALYMDGKR